MSLVACATTTDTEEKQLAANSDDKPVVAETAENVTPATFELADQHFGLSVDLLKKNELNDAIDNAYEAVAIGEEACEDVNDIRLAKYFIQHGKCLLTKIQQTKELLVDTEEANDEAPNEPETEMNGQAEKKTTEVDDGNSNGNNNSNDNNCNKSAIESHKEAKTDTEKRTDVDKNKDSKKEKETENKGGKTEIDSDEEEEDIDIDIGDKKNDNDGDNGDGDENGDIENGEEYEDEYEFENSDRAVCWEVLDSARVIIRKHLESLGVEFDDQDENGNENEQVDGNEQNGVVNGVSNAEAAASDDTKDSANASNETDKTETNDDEAQDIDIVDANNDKQKNQEQEKEKEKNNEQENAKEQEKKENKDDDDNGDESKDDEKEEMIVKYMLELAEVHSLQGDHQLEDNGFCQALECYEESLRLKMECSESNRELAYSHYMAALAASHARQYDIMEQHCIDAMDLLNDRILTLIDSFDNEKYKEKTANEEMDEAALIAIVEEFQKEYQSKLESLSKEEQDKLSEIGDLLGMMEGINEKMETELVDARKLDEIEELQGQSIKDLVMQMMQQNGLNIDKIDENGNDNSNGNDNTNDNTNNINNDSDNKNNGDGIVNVGGISFGSAPSNDENSNANSNTMNDVQVKVNTLSVKSRKSKKRSLDDAGIPNDDPSPMKKPKMVKPKNTVVVANGKEQL